MKAITCYTTFDGKLHMHERAALRHLDVIEAETVSHHAHKLAALEKYTKIGDYLIEHAEEISLLVKIKADRKLIGGDDE